MIVWIAHAKVGHPQDLSQKPAADAAGFSFLVHPHGWLPAFGAVGNPITQAQLLPASKGAAEGGAGELGPSFIVYFVVHGRPLGQGLCHTGHEALARMELAEFEVIQGDCPPGRRTGAPNNTVVTWRSSRQLRLSHAGGKSQTVYLRLPVVPAASAPAPYSVIIPLVIVSWYNVLDMGL